MDRPPTALAPRIHTEVSYEVGREVGRLTSVGLEKLRRLKVLTPAGPETELTGSSDTWPGFASSVPLAPPVIAQVPTVEEDTAVRPTGVRIIKVPPSAGLPPETSTLAQTIQKLILGEEREDT